MDNKWKDKKPDIDGYMVDALVGYVCGLVLWWCKVEGRITCVHGLGR